MSCPVGWHEALVSVVWELYGKDIKRFAIRLTVLFVLLITFYLLVR